MVHDKIEILKDLFYGQKRDPHKNSGLFDHYLAKVRDAEPWVLRKAVDEALYAYQVLPNISQLLMLIHKHTPQNDIGTTPCVICEAGGLVYGVYCYKEEGGYMEVASFNHTVCKGAIYREQIIGRCKCPNGMAFMLSANQRLATEVDPPSFLKNKSDESGMSCMWEAQLLARDLSRQARGAGDVKPNRTLQGVIDKIVANLGDDEAQPEELNPMFAGAETVQSEIFDDGELPF